MAIFWYFLYNARRLQRLEHLAAKFEHKAINIEKWASDHPEKLSRNDDIDAANLAEATVSFRGKEGERERRGRRGGRERERERERERIAL